jgi:hypothetical protein
MKMRVFFAIVLILLGCAVAMWWWPAGGVAIISAQTPRPLAVSPSPALVSVQQSTPAPGQESSATPAVPTPPVRFTSAVMPGQPVYRSSPAPAAKAVEPASAASGLSQPTMRDPEGKREVEEVRTMFTNYVTRLGQIPVGTNSEIMKAVMGENRDRVTLGPPHGQELNGKGELVDQWGTPYFFHQLAKDSMEIRSAGPDMTMWTTDDLVTK